MSSPDGPLMELPAFLSGGTITFRTETLNSADLPLAERERCMSTLQESFHKASAGEVSCVIIEGELGSGKANLVDSFRASQVKTPDGNSALFCSGTFDSGAEPHGGIVEALDHIVTWIVKTGDHQLWRGALLNALGDELPVLEFLLPALHLFLDHQA